MGYRGTDWGAGACLGLGIGALVPVLIDVRDLWLAPFGVIAMIVGFFLFVGPRIRRLR
jgi:hypothetical protein